MTKTVEIVTFRTHPQHSAGDVHQAAAAMKGFLHETGGMAQRTLSQDADGLWTGHILWNSLEDAQRAAARIGTAPEAQAFIAMIDGPSVTMRHATLHLQME
ncbi:hypothetical protein [Aestuariivita boseongensis]|uniref:hypothetical protein n=1 Tax=Aestuariivita boseongensis TaxID=1470562 RepID=UPI000680A0DB|nr:hypothetical protein [Aestuariivita boseongensis]